jgi:hypothetical protein
MSSLRASEHVKESTILLEDGDVPVVPAVAILSD